MDESLKSHQLESQSLVTLSFHLHMLVFILLHVMFDENTLCISGSTVALSFWSQIKSSNTFDVRRVCRKHGCRRKDVQRLSQFARCRLPLFIKTLTDIFYISRFLYFFCPCILHAWLLFCCLVKSLFLKGVTANFCHHITHLRHISLIVFCSY